MTDAVWERKADEGGVEVSYGLMYPDASPPGLRSLLAGRIDRGVFYPDGSVSRHFFEMQRARRADVATCAKPHVYFVRSERGGPVKIGIATDIEARLSGLQTSHPYRLSVIAVIPNGGREKEKEIHERLAASRLIGEWFEWSDELAEVIRGS